MNITETPTGIRAYDWPEIWWVFGTISVCLGVTFVLWPLGLIGGTPLLEVRARLASLTVGTIGVGIGSWLVVSTPLSRIEIDYVDRVVRITRWGITGRVDISVAFADIQAADIDTNLTGNPYQTAYRPRLRLKDGTTFPMSMVYETDGSPAQRVVREIMTRIGPPNATG
jgi:hypothetical protein